MKRIALISVAALLMASCTPQKQMEEKQLTPQEQIIANIARTSFPDKVWPVQLDESVNMLQVLQATELSIP